MNRPIATSLEFVVLQQHPDFVVGSVGRICIMRSLQPLSAGAIEGFAAAATAMLREHDRGIFLVFVPGAKRPSVSNEARAAIREHWPTMAATSLSAAIWFRRSGFVAALGRSLATTILLALGQTDSIEPCASAEEILKRFVEEDPSVSIDHDRWVAGLDAFAAQFDP